MRERVMYDARRALELLRAGARQRDAGFREGQEEAIRHVVEGRGRLLVVQKTGWGKSFVYFIATKLLRESDMGPALLVSPLLALMRNQIEAADRMGARAATIHSDNQDDWREVEDAVRRDEVDILLVSPERFANERFHNEVLAEVADRISLLVTDAAHSRDPCCWWTTWWILAGPSRSWPGSFAEGAAARYGRSLSQWRVAIHERSTVSEHPGDSAADRAPESPADAGGRRRCSPPRSTGLSPPVCIPLTRSRPICCNRARVP